MEGLAFWAKGTNIHPVDTRHIQFISQNPDKFGMTREQIWAVYDKHGEKRGFEGKAREEIIKWVAEDGWVRIRHYESPKDYWSIQSHNIRSSSTRRTVENFIFWALEQEILSLTDELILVSYNGDQQVNYLHSEGGLKVYLTEVFKRKKRILDRN